MKRKVSRSISVTKNPLHKWPFFVGGFLITGLLILVFGWTTYWFTAGIFEKRQLVFDEDFQTGYAANVYPKTSNWGIVTNGENKVYQANNPSKTDWIWAEFGPRVFSNGVIQYHFMIVDYDAPIYGSGMSYVFFRINGDWNQDSYTFQIQPTNEYLTVDYVPKLESNWVTLGNINMSISTNTWYTVRVEVHENQIKVYLNHSLLIDSVDSKSRLSSGRLGFQVGPKTTILYDEVKVWQE